VVQLVSYNWNKRERKWAFKYNGGASGCESVYFYSINVNTTFRHDAIYLVQDLMTLLSKKRGKKLIHDDVSRDV